MVWEEKQAKTTMQNYVKYLKDCPFKYSFGFGFIMPSEV